MSKCKNEFKSTEERIRYYLDVQRGILDGEPMDYAKIDDIQYGDTVQIEWQGDELEGVIDLGYIFGWPDIESHDANMGGIVHIPDPANPGGKDRAHPEWVTLYELTNNPMVKSIRVIQRWRGISPQSQRQGGER